MSRIVLQATFSTTCDLDCSQNQICSLIAFRETSLLFSHLNTCCTTPLAISHPNMNAKAGGIGCNIGKLTGSLHSPKTNDI